MKYVLHLTQKDPWHCLCSMLTQVLIPCPIWSRWERRLHGKCGRHMVNFTVTSYELHNAPEQIDEVAEASLSYFTIRLYERTATSRSINEVRKNLFIHKGCQISGLPPTKAALQQHMKRAVLQGGHHWGCTTVPEQQLPSPSEWVWTCPEQWRPLWSNLPKASATCPELLECSCRGGCTDCKCVDAHLKSTAYCKLKIDCDTSV